MKNAGACGFYPEEVWGWGEAVSALGFKEEEAVRWVVVGGGLGDRGEGGSVSWELSPAGCGECGSCGAGWWQIPGIVEDPGIVKDDTEPKGVVVLLSDRFREPVGSRPPSAPLPPSPGSRLPFGKVLASTGNRKVGSLNLLLAEETVGSLLFAGFPVPEKR